MHDSKTSFARSCLRASFEKTFEAFLIDPSDEAQAVEESIKNMTRADVEKKIFSTWLSQTKLKRKRKMKKKTTETGKDKVRETLEQLEQGVADVFSSERYERYLKFIASFYEYSLNNVLLIAMQRPTATLVAGFNAWKKRGRVVKAGEKGIRILAPIPRRSVSTATNDDETVFVVKNWITYRVAYVFDVAQTEGDDLPTLATKLEGDVDEYAKLLDALVETSPVPVEFGEIEGEALGYYLRTERTIRVREGMSESQTIKTLIHEIAHAELHADPTRVVDRQTKEVEAESVAFVVCSRLGVDASEYSFGYVAGWSRDRETKELRSSLETIRDASTQIIEKIERAIAVRDQKREAVAA